MTVTRATLCERAMAAGDLPRSDVVDLCERMFELIGDSLAAGETVKLTGFGTLEVRTRAERIGRNPRTGEQHAITPHKVVMLIPSARLRTRLAKTAAT